MRPVAVWWMLLIGVGLGGLLPSQPAQAQTSTAPVIIQADAFGLTLEWQPPPVEVVEVEANGITYSRLDAPGLAFFNRPGAPQLPVFSRLIGLPPGSEASLSIIALEQDTLALPHPPLPAPTPRPVSFEQAQSLTGGGPVTVAPDAALYRADALFPATFATLDAPEQVRGHTLTRLVVNPVRVNPVTRQGVVIRRIRLEIRFDAPAAPSLAAQNRPDAFAGALAATLLNPQAAAWAAPQRPASGIDPAPPLLATATESPPLKVVVDTAGLYRLTYAELLSAGWPVDSLNPQTIRLSYGAGFSPVAIRVEGEADASFDPGDRILFFARPAFSRTSTEDVYFLSYDAAAPPRVEARSGNPAGLPVGIAWRTAAAETNAFYEPLYPDHNGDRWYWQRLVNGSQAIAEGTEAANLSIDAPGLNGSGAAAALTLWLQGFTSSSHTVTVTVNGNAAGVLNWSGKTQLAEQLSIPAGWLLTHANTVRLELASTGAVLLDAVALRYPAAGGDSSQLLFAGEAGPQAYALGGWASDQLHVWDVTAPLTPVRVTDFTYAAGNMGVGQVEAGPREYLVAPEVAIKAPLRLEAVRLLSDPAGGADMIIITHPDFAAAVAPLAAHRAGQGLRVFTTDVTAVYDTFGGGRMSPQAVRAFLQHAYQTWPVPAPLYVLLVGDGAYDFKNYSGFNPQNFIPPHLAEVDPWLGETASDNRLVNFDGGMLPSMWIGRLPVSSAAQAETVISKIIQYETNPVPGEWNMRHLFVAGDECCGTSSPSATSLQSQAEAGLALLPASGIGIRYYFDDSASAGKPDYVYTDYVQLRDNLVAGFSQGAATVVFHGHSSWHQWNDEPLLRWSFVPADHDIDRLVNGRRLPVVLSLSCFTGSFHHPEYPTLDESLLTRGGGGAVAVWGATGLGVASGHELLQQGFYAGLGGKSTNLGAALFAGKSMLYGGSVWEVDRALIDTFTLFGDPAMTVNLTVRPFTDFVYLPLVRKRQ